MRIEAAGLSKRFTRRWIVRDFTYAFARGSRTAIVGPNGSGKSTLLRLLSGQLIPSAGALRFDESLPGETPGRAVGADAVYRRVSLTGPYLELIEELTGEELLTLHGRLRGFRQNLRPDDLWGELTWSKGIRRQRISSYSSGMKQRIRLLLALGTEASVVFLDEPTSNLDTEGVDWYHRLLTTWADDRTIVVASNEERDFAADSTRLTSASWTAKDL